MTSALRLREFLTARGVPYGVIFHPRCETALQTAEIEHIPSSRFLKVVMVKVKGENAMFAIPSDRVLDMLKLSSAFGTKDIQVEEEGEFSSLFPDCEIGAMPPFGFLYVLPCYMDKVLKDEEEVFFNAGCHKETMKMTLKDYLRSAEVKIGDYSVPKKSLGTSLRG